MSSVRMKSITAVMLDSFVEMRFSSRPSVFLHRSSWYMILSRQVFTSGRSMLYVGPYALLPKTSSPFPPAPFAAVPCLGAPWAGMGGLFAASTRTPPSWGGSRFCWRSALSLRYSAASLRLKSWGCALMPSLFVTNTSVPTLACVAPGSTSVLCGFRLDFQMMMF